MSDPEANPYAAPSVQAPVAPATTYGTGSGQVLKSPVMRGRVAIGFVVVYTMFWSLSNLMMAMVGHMIDEELADVQSLRHALIVMAFLTMGGFIGSVISVCLWTYRCASNARILNRLRMSMSPGMAVGSHFIPFYNFFGPYRAMSDTAVITEEASRRSGISRLVLPWWLCWIFAIFLNRIASKMAEQDTEGSTYVLVLLSVLLLLAAAILLCFIIVKLSAAQDSIEPGPRQPLPSAPHVRPTPSSLPPVRAVTPAPGVSVVPEPGAPVPRRPGDEQP